MIKTGSAITALVITACFSSLIPYDNTLGIAFRLSQFEMLGIAAGIAVVMLLKERRGAALDESGQSTVGGQKA